MSPKAFIGFALAAVVSLAAAGIAVSQQSQFEVAGSSGKPLLPGLLERVNDVASVVVENQGRSITIRRRGDTWTLADPDGYPVRADKVRAAVLGLARLVAHEPKTRNKDHYASLDLGDPDAEEAKAKRLSLLDKDGAVIARIVVGKTKYSAFGEGEGGVYVRKPGDPQTWLARGSLDPGTGVSDWIETTVANIAADRVARITIRHPDGETVVASRTPADAKDLTLDGLPAGYKPKNQWTMSDLAGIMSSFQVEDVRRDDGAGDADAVHAEIRTRDGLTVTAAVIKRDGKRWARLAFAADPGAAKDPGAAADKADEPKDPVAEARDLNAKTKGWLFAINSFRADNLTRRMPDLIEKEKAAGS